MITPLLFADHAVDPDTRAFLATFAARTRNAPSVVNTPIPALRAARANGSAALQIVKLDSAGNEVISGPDGDLPLRSFTPERPRGAFLHFHGGGFVMGAPDQQDVLLDTVAAESGLAVISAGYRLAPEWPFPAASDDALAAALWFIDAARAGRFNGGPLFIGGESAGAYLVVTTLLRLRAMGLADSFRAAVLNYGVFDLGLTPSARNWGDRYAIISTPILRRYVDAFLPSGVDLRSPEVSPFYARLDALPPALFSVGTRDPLLDDSLLMSQRWIAAGNEATLAVYPGGIHAFSAFDIPIAADALRRQVEFLRGHSTP